MIEKITLSNKTNKRFDITMNSGKIYSFGLKDGSTYIDHHDKILRSAYWARHYANGKEKQLILNLVPSPALFSAFILWGKYTHINDNIRYLNKLWKQKYDNETLDTI